MLKPSNLIPSSKLTSVLPVPSGYITGSPSVCSHDIEESSSSEVDSDVNSSDGNEEDSDLDEEEEEESTESLDEEIELRQPFFDREEEEEQEEEEEEFEDQNERERLEEMRKKDSIAFVALMIPICGISTMIGTIVLSCRQRFDCSEKYPTLSYAATFKPEGTVFMAGMCTTALFIQATIGLFYWFLRLKLSYAHRQSRRLMLSVLSSGSFAAFSLFMLAVLDMGNYHDSHILFTITFFISAWMTIVSAQMARTKILQRRAGTTREDVRAESLEAATSCPHLVTLITNKNEWSKLTAYTFGRVCLISGIISTFIFALLFLCVNNVWPNPMGFTAVQEAAFELFAIICQLFYMGSLASELSMLTQAVEHKDYLTLSRKQ